MVQREVRDRLLAPPATKAYGALSVFVQTAFAVRPVLTVPPGAFHPAPKVASAVVELVPRNEAWDPDAEPFRSLVRAAFERRRKTLRNALGVLADNDQASNALSRAGIDPSARGETLSVEDFVRLAAAWSEDRS
jgi:16S rRNA (adenine1518-N6/adenine1519-N6)-dimethyltransferase